MYDVYTGLEDGSFRATASFPVAGFTPGGDFAGRFREVGVFELKLSEPIPSIAGATLEISVRDVEGNTTRVRRRFGGKR